MCASCLNGDPRVGFHLTKLVLAHPLLHTSHHILVLETVWLLIVLVEEEIDGEAFVLMSAEDIVAMVKSRGAQLKLAEKKRQLSLIYPPVEAKVSFPLNQI